MQHAAVIRSRDNPVLKRAGAVQAGRASDAILLEGERLVDEARAAGMAFESVLVSEEREDLARELEAAGLPVRRAEARLLARVSDLVTSPGVLALCAPPPARALDELELGRDALALAVAGLSEPGNLGALARSAEAAGASFLALVAGGVSPWNPKALRGSMGSLLRLPVVRFASAREASATLARHGFRQACAATRGGERPTRFDWSGRLALWIGAESGALPQEAASFERITIPMAGRVESLNVAVAAALLLFAAGRAERGAR
jgi:TrmH family RNA methyltransferase